MDNGMYVALSRQMILRRQMDVVANNIANADTAGFKVEKIIINSDPKRLSTPEGPGSLTYVTDPGVARNYGQGALSRTGAPLDMAIEGEGFFKIGAERGERFTRDGRFAVDGEGRLVTKAGDPVLDDGGAEITVDPSKGEISVSREGSISQGGLRVGKVGVYRFDELAGLSKDGDGLYRNDGNIPAQAAPDALVHQGMVESSNVQPILEITSMIEISRAYERIVRMMDQNSDLDRRSIERLGRVNA